MLKRFGRYVFNSLKVAVVCMSFFALQHVVPWGAVPTAPLGGKIIVGVITWAVWSFMVMIVDDGQDNKRRKDMKHHEARAERLAQDCREGG